MQHWIEIWVQDTIPYSRDWSQEIFKVHVPINSSTHLLCLWEEQFLPFLWWSLVWPVQGFNQRPGAWEADMQTTERTRCRYEEEAIMKNSYVTPSTCTLASGMSINGSFLSSTGPHCMAYCSMVTEATFRGGSQPTVAFCEKATGVTEMFLTGPGLSSAY